MNLFKENILVIGDLHAPFIKKGYLEHCISTYKRFKCNKVVFIGDIYDGHAISYHEKDPNGLSAGDELKAAKKELAKWHKAFPNAYVTIGNHDKLITRKLMTNGLPIEFVKSLNEILDLPTWKFDISYEFNEVIYTHGEGGGGIGGSLTKALNRRKSIVQGHYHTEALIRWNVSDYDRIFAMQVGCGMDDRSYAAAYAKYNIKKSIISCGVVLDNGKLPIVIPMDL